MILTKALTRTDGNGGIMAIIALMAVCVSIGIMTTHYHYLAILPGCGILFFLFLTRFPVTVFYMFIALIPFGAYRGLKEPYDFIEIPWLLALGLITLIFFRTLLQRKFPRELATTLWLPLGLFVAVNTISALMSAFPATALKQLIMLSLALLYIILALVFIAPDKLWSLLPRVFMFSISLTSFLACIGYFFNIALFAEQVHSGFKRGIGGTTDPNNLALMILFVVPFLAHSMFTARSTMIRVFYGLLILINLAALGTTFSRSGAMVLGPICIGILIENRKRFKARHVGILIATAMTGLIAIVIMMPEGYIQRQLSLAGKTDQSVSRRTSYLNVGWNAVINAPLLGSGPGTFRELYALSSDSKRYGRKGETRRRYAHNSYVEIVVGTGILGLTIFLILIFMVLKNFTRAKKHFTLLQDPIKASMAGAYRLALVGILVYLLFLSDTLNKYMLLLVALSHIMVRASETQEPAVEGSKA